MDNNKMIIALVIVLIVMLVAGILILNPGRTDSKVIVTSNATMHDGDIFSIHLTDLNNTPISNQVVNITLIDANGGRNIQNVTTNVNGDGSLQLNGLAVGQYTVEVNFGGNATYKGCNTTQKLQITEKVTSQEQTSTNSSSSSSSNYDDGYWETSADANFEYHTEYYPDGNLRQYDRSGRLVGSTYAEDQYEVGSNVGFKI